LSELKTIFEDKRYCNSLGPMTVTDNGFFGCHTVEHADQNSFLDTDINLNVLSYLSSDDKSLIKCDGNSTYMCDTSSSVNKKIYEKCGNIRVSRSHVRKSCRVRNREPARVALKRIIKSLKKRKAAAKCKLFIRITVPVSSVLYSIVSNFKQQQWNITFAKKQDGFFSNSQRNSAL